MKKMQEERPDLTQQNEEKQMVQEITRKYQKINQKIELAMKKARRKDQVKLIAVSKRKGEEAIQMAISLGMKSFGENYLQEAEQKKEVFSSVELHFIGKIQTGKMNRIVKLFDWVQTIETIEQLEKLNKKAEHLDKKLKALLQINIGGEETKQGWTAKKFMETLHEIKELQKESPMIEIKGLMTILPYNLSEKELREYYSTMRSLGEKMAKELKLEKVELSYGMSDDYEVAIEEGATMVRVGRALFGERMKY